MYLPISRCFRSIELYVGSKKASLFALSDGSPLDLPLDEWPIWFSYQENEGFTKTVNKGLYTAFRCDTDIVIVMNDDIEMTKECFDRFSILKGLQIASPRDTASSDDDRFGACWGMTRDVYDLLGPLNEKYKNFYSDLDYYNRAKEAGVEIIKWNDITLEHPESSTYKLLNKETLLKEDAKRYNEGR